MAGMHLLDHGCSMGVFQVNRKLREKHLVYQGLSFLISKAGEIAPSIPGSLWDKNEVMVYQNTLKVKSSVEIQTVAIAN